MALLNKFIWSRRKSQKQGYVAFGKNEGESWKPFNFSKEQVRVLLFRECDWRGRKLLFDSKAVQKVSLESETGSRLKFGSRPKVEKKKSEMYVEVSNGYGYQYLKPSSDVTVLGEMIFGSVAMTFQGTAFKVHSMKNPARLMCTKVFHSPISSSHSRGISDQSLEESFGSSVNSMSEFLASHNSGDIKPTSFESRPLDITDCELRVKQPSNSLEVDSGFCGDASLRSTSSISSVGYSGTSPDSRRSSSSMMTNPMAYHSGGSLASLQRRWLRNMSTSLEVGLQNGSWSSRSSTDDASIQHNHRRTKLGLAVIIDLSPEEDRAMELFSFEHMTLIEGILDRLRYCVEHAYTHKEAFVHLMVEGSQDVQQWLVDVFCAPRLTSPVWLSLTSGANLMNSALTFNFLQDLCQLIARNDTKATNFFISTLLTAVLTHHLGWVATVLPGKIPLHHISKKSCTGQMLHALSKSHPYNPLWAQLGDMYGALGYPTKVARTIVISGMGKKTEMLDRILNILSYFVRCGEVEKRIITEDTSLETSSASTPVNIEAGKEEESSAGPLSPALEMTAIQNGTECKDFTATLLGPPKFLYKSFFSSEDKIPESRDCNSSSKAQQVPNHVSDYAEAFAEIKENCVFFINKRKADINGCGHHSNSILEVVNSSHCLPHEIEMNGSNFDQMNIMRNVGIGLKHSATLRNNLCNSLHEAQKCNENVKDNNNSLTEHTGLKHNKTFTGDLSALVATMGETEEASMKSSQLSTVLAQNDLDSISDVRESVVNVNPDEQLSCELNRENGRLYPDLSHITSVGNVDKSSSSLRMEEITEKVSRLCRVPASAIVYHLKGSAEEKETDDVFLPKRIDCERQRSSASSTSSSVASLVQRTLASDNQAGGKSPEGGVKFILGDNEELVGLRSPTKSTNEGSKVITQINNREFSLEKENTNEIIENFSECGNNNHENSHNREEILGLDNKMCSLNSEIPTSLCRDCGRQESDVSLRCHNSRTFESTDKEIASLFRDISLKKNNRVVTVRSSIIELEYEEGSYKTSVEQSRKPVCRSLSVSYPISHERKSSRLCRRHSDCVHGAGRYLRDYHSVRFHFQLHDAALNGYVQYEKTEMESEVDKINGARGNFQHSNAALLSCKHLPSKTDISVSSCFKNNTSCSKEPAYLETIGQDSVNKTAFNNGCDREENALFEDYNNLCGDEYSAAEKSKEQSVEVPSKKLGSPKIQELPLPSCVVEKQSERLCGFSASLLGTVSDHYIPDFVLQGCTQLPKGWETNLRRDLSLAAHHSLLDQEVSEAVCIVANVDTWEVQLVSSHTYLVDKPGTLGVRVGMSRLVANMLESLLYLWKLKTSPEHCLLHLESKLRELCLRSQALAELLLTTEFCDMDTLTSSLDLDANDVPLLLAIASTHSPQVTERYGLSFR